MKEIKKLYLFTFFRSFIVFASISIAFYSSNGLSYFQIMLLQSLYAITTAIMEIPSGILSDMLGRKKTLLIGTLSFIFAYFLGTLGTNIIPFAIMQIFAAIGQSCYSGTFLALMYEDIKNATDIHKSTNVIFANMQMINLVSALSASLVSVFFVKYISMRATYLITALMYCITLVINLMLHENRKMVEPVNKIDYSLKSYILIFMDSLHVIAKSGLICLFLDMIMFACFANSLLYLQQPLLIDRSFPVTYFGVVTVIIALLTTFALKFVGFIEKKIKNLNIFLKTLTVIVIIMLISNLLLKNSLWVIFTFIILSIVIRIREIFITTRVNQVIGDSTRATVMSIVSAIEMLGFAVLGSIVGYCEDKSVNFALILTSSVIVIVYGIFWTISWKINKEKKDSLSC